MLETYDDLIRTKCPCGDSSDPVRREQTGDQPGITPGCRLSGQVSHQLGDPVARLDETTTLRVERPSGRGELSPCCRTTERNCSPIRGGSTRGRDLSPRATGLANPRGRRQVVPHQAIEHLLGITPAIPCRADFPVPDARIGL
jgi:hypothetical protein